MTVWRARWLHMPYCVLASALSLISEFGSFPHKQACQHGCYWILCSYSHFARKVSITTTLTTLPNHPPPPHCLHHPPDVTTPDQPVDVSDSWSRWPPPTRASMPHVLQTVNCSWWLSGWKFTLELWLDKFLLQNQGHWCYRCANSYFKISKFADWQDGHWVIKH